MIAGERKAIGSLAYMERGSVWTKRATEFGNNMRARTYPATVRRQVLSETSDPVSGLGGKDGPETGFRDTRDNTQILKQ
jgi:hypothetical protein